MKQKTPIFDKAYRLAIYAEPSAQRRVAERFIAEQFYLQHHAAINEFLPVILAVIDREEQVVAAAGVRLDTDNAFFLESYLEHQVQQHISEQFSLSDNAVQRSSIVEIGNLASVSVKASRFLFQQLFLFCQSHQKQWVVFTSCQRLRDIFARLKLPLSELAKAKQEKLASQLSDWGSYYKDSPAVLAGYLADGQVLLARS